MANPSPAATRRTPWKFFRIGGLDQVAFEKGEDLTRLRELDQKLWVALSCPVKGLVFDERTLALIDSDNDGRVRAPELIAAAEWAGARLADADALVARDRSRFPVTAITTATPEGRALATAARRVLANLGRAQDTSLSVDDVSNTARIFADTALNGDGVVAAPAAGSDAATAAAIADIIRCIGPVTDRSGQPGVDKATVAAFFTEAAAFADWWDAGERQSAPGSGVLPLGTDTPAAFAALNAVREKVDDYFARCRLAAFDNRATAHLNRPDSEYAALAGRLLPTATAEIAALPLSRIAPDQPLDLLSGINPAWSAAIATLRARVIGPLLGANRAAITASEWDALVARFTPYATWLGGKAGPRVEPLGIARTRELLASGARAAIEALIEQDLALAPEVGPIQDLERLVRYHRDLLVLARNFVSFSAFYSRSEWAIFQAGTLYLDSRSCELCIQVADPGSHAGLASLSKCYIAYCDARRPGEAPMKIAAVFSNGDSDFLMPGRNGIFYDTRGRDWDATIVKVIDNPISIRQAFFSPYKKLVRMIEEQVAKRAAAAEGAADAKLASAAAATASVGSTPAAAAHAGQRRQFDAGVVAAIGVAISGLISALTLILGYVFGLAWWQYPLVLLGIIAVISGPSMLIAWLKLRQRTLGPLLDANGWAVNGRVRINLPLGTSLTDVKSLPAGATRVLADPFEDKSAARRRREFILLIILAGTVTLAWFTRSHWYEDLTGRPMPAWMQPASNTPAQAVPEATPPA